MKALSFHQPRAEQVIRGEKTLDVRTWQASYRGELAVHASGERRDERCRALGFDPAALAYGALVGTVELTGIVALDEAAYEALRDQHRLDTPFPGAPVLRLASGQPLPFRRADPLPRAKTTVRRGDGTRRTGQKTGLSLPHHPAAAARPSAALCPVRHSGKGWRLSRRPLPMAPTRQPIA